MKLESLVITDKYAVVNTFPGLVHTACHAMEVLNAQSPVVGGMKASRMTGAKS